MALSTRRNIDPDALAHRGDIRKIAVKVGHLAENDTKGWVTKRDELIKQLAEYPELDGLSSWTVKDAHDFLSGGVIPDGAEENQEVVADAPKKAGRRRVKSKEVVEAEPESQEASTDSEQEDKKPVRRRRRRTKSEMAAAKEAVATEEESAQVDKEPTKRRRRRRTKVEMAEARASDNGEEVADGIVDAPDITSNGKAEVSSWVKQAIEVMGPIVGQTKELASNTDKRVSELDDKVSALLEGVTALVKWATAEYNMSIRDDHPDLVVASILDVDEEIWEESTQTD